MRAMVWGTVLAAAVVGLAHAQDTLEDASETAQPTIEDLALEPLGSGGVGQIEAEPRDADAFVAANLEWLLLHALATTLTETLGYDAPNADGADAFASSRLSARHDEATAAVRLVAVAEAMALAAEGDAPAYFEANDLDRARAFRVLCVANGADNAQARAALRFADAPKDEFDACRVDRDLATEEWDVALSADYAFPGDPPADVTASYGEAGPNDEDAAFIRETSLLEMLAEETAETYALFEPVTIEARSCDGGEGLIAEAGSLVLCYGVVRDLRALVEPVSGKADQ